MIYLVTYGGSRPNRITEIKDRDYHARYARFCVYNANNSKHQEFLAKINVNKQFYVGNQWIDEEDLEEFLKDDTGEFRNRLRIVNNVIRPMVEQYRGNAIRMEYNARLKSFSKRAINRREQSLAEMLLHFDSSQKVPSLKPMLKRRYGVGDSVEETVQIFENTYVDQYIETMNDLITHVALINDFDSIKFESAIPLALNGMCITKYFEYAGNMRFDQVLPEHFFWDRSAKKYDLSDSGYMGETLPMEVTDVLEQFPNIQPEEQKAIEDWSVHNMSNVGAKLTAAHETSATKVPTFMTYWKDTEKVEYGYVMDEFGYPYLTKINFTYPGEDQPRYTDKDLILVDPGKQKRVLNGKIKKSIYVDVIRYCHFIPVEIVGNNSTKVQKDIVLDHGVLIYQDTDNIDFHSAKFPYCIYTWAYLDGQVISPIDDAIDPQRLINRILSVTENQINNSRGAGTIIDSTMFENKDAQAEAVKAMNQSRPVFVEGRGKGMQNMVSSYDGTVRQGTQVLFNVIETLQSYTSRMTGVNEALQGQQGSPDQLVGTTAMMIQRGSLIQEPFYNAMSEMMKRCYQAIATFGKNLYADNERELAVAVGDAGARIIMISKDMKAEDFRTFVVREKTDESLINAGNAMLMQFMQFGLIDDLRAADLINRATPDQVSMAVRQYAKEKIEMRRQAVKNKEAQMENMYERMGTEQKLAGAREEQNQLANKESQERAENSKLQNTILQNESKERVAAMSKGKQTPQQ